MKLTWTKTDEAPALASYALLPILQAYFKGTGVEIETADISLAGRIIANFPECLRNDQKIPDELTRLGELAQTPDANIIKLPNISASIPQLREAIAELRGKGYNIPDYPEEPSTEEERALQARFAVVLGSAVNPVLREGNSDRRASKSVKAFAQKHPHKMMKNWPKSGSVTRVAHMNDKDFYGSEKSTTVGAATNVRIEFVDSAGAVKVLKQSIPLLEGEVIDCAVMNVAALRRFYAEQMAAAKADNALLSLHLKCTMMKISDPDHVRALCGGVFRRCPGEACRRDPRNRRQRQQRTGRRPRQTRPASGREEGRDRGRYRSLLRPGPRLGDGRFAAG